MSDYVEYDLCTNCVMVAANDDDSGRDPARDPEPLSLVDPRHHLSLQTLDHADGCTLDARREHGCDCGDLGFRAAPCEGCGNAAGDRYRMTAFLS